MPKTVPVPCTKEEIDSIVDTAFMNGDEFAHLLFTVAKKTGRRLGEYYDVKVKDLDFERGIMMTKVLKRRMRVDKEAILDDELMNLLKRYIAKKALKLEDYLFREVGYRQIQNKIVKYAKEAGVKHKVSFHNFRHYFVTELFKKGWTYDKIAKLTGHSSVGTLAMYDHTVASDLAVKARADIKGL